MHTQFFEQWRLTGESAQKAEKVHEKAWAYVGRFYWGFGMIDNSIEEIFATLFDLNDAGVIFLRRSNVDLRKKLHLIKVGRESQDIDDGKLLNRVHALCDKQKMIAQRTFVVDELGIDFDYVEERRRLRLPDGAKGRATVANTNRDKKHARRNEYIRPLTAMGFFWFDNIDKEMADIWSDLEVLLASVKPITDLGPYLESEIKKIIEDTTTR